MKRGFFGSGSGGDGRLESEPAYGSSSQARQPTSTGQPPKLPKRLLHSYDDFLKLCIPLPNAPPRGMPNCGNSCFAASSLQCLGATPQLARYFFQVDHECTRPGCLVCVFRDHCRSKFNTDKRMDLSPIVHYIKRIAKHFVQYRQEDAHDFVQNLLDKLHEGVLELIPPPPGEKKHDPQSQETTMLYHVFGGKTRSQVWCHNCGSVSNSYESFLTLSLEVTGKISCLSDALFANFASRDELYGANAYRCDTCKALTPATRTMRIHTPPNALVIALKRYTTGLFGKINKKVTYDLEMDLGEYMCESAPGSGAGTSARARADPQRYSLYGVIVHLDWALSTASGHYVCYVKIGGRWYKCDDASVTPALEDTVLTQTAYMLFYQREAPRDPPTAEEEEEAAEAGRGGRPASVVGPPTREAAAAAAAAHGHYSNGAGAVRSGDSLQVHQSRFSGRYGTDQGADQERLAAAAESRRLAAQQQQQQQGYGSNGHNNGYHNNGHNEPYGPQAGPSPPAVPAGGGLGRRHVPESPASEPTDSGSTIFPARPGTAAYRRGDEEEAPEVSSSVQPGEVEPDYEETVDGPTTTIQVYLPGLTSQDLQMETIPRDGVNWVSLVAPGRFRLSKEVDGTVVSAKFAKSRHVLTIRVDRDGERGSRPPPRDGPAHARAPSSAPARAAAAEPREYRERSSARYGEPARSVAAHEAPRAGSRASQRVPSPEEAQVPPTVAALYARNAISRAQAAAGVVLPASGHSDRMSPDADRAEIMRRHRQALGAEEEVYYD